MEVELTSNFHSKTDKLAVEVKNAYKSYSKDSFVLRGFNMSVRKGSIYGLLGPSGCGKTTLLNCIVGRCTLDAGEINLIVNERKHIGYMPQELSLYREFSIWETFVYFGKLFKIPSKLFRQKIDELKCLLNLPSLKMLCGNLSGGQQRRVSFAVVLLHNPDLLILDEPTVGVDPILSASIWNYFLQLSQQGRTVVITTHYIEEAKQANCIGLMRDGVLLAEDSPRNLMAKHDSPTLEHAFLILSLRQQEDSTNRNCEPSGPSKKQKTAQVNWESNETCTVPRINAQFIKQYYWMKRNISGVLFTLFLPVVILLVFDFSIGHSPKNVSMAVVNYEVLANCSNCPAKQVAAVCPANLLSCQYMQYLKKYDMILKPYRNINEAYAAVRRNQVWGAVEFPSNYTSSLLERIEVGRSTTPDTERSSNLYITLDMSSYVSSMFLYRHFYDSYDEFMGAVSKKLNITDRLLKIPIKFEKPVHGKAEIDFSEFAMPAVLVICIFYLPYIFTSAAVVMEKKQGLMERSMIAGVTGTEVFLAYMVMQVFMLTLQLVLMMVLQFYIFRFPINSSLFWPSALLFLEGLCGTFFGFAAGFLFDGQITITLLGVGAIVPQFFMSGMLWPIEGMHPVIRVISCLLPLTLPVNSVRAIMTKNWTVLNSTVYVGFICVVSWILFFVLLSLLGLKYKRTFNLGK